MMKFINLVFGMQYISSGFVLSALVYIIRKQICSIDRHMGKNDWNEHIHPRKGISIISAYHA